MMTTVNFPSDIITSITMNPWFSRFLVGTSYLSMKSWYTGNVSTGT